MISTFVFPNVILLRISACVVSAFETVTVAVSSVFTLEVKIEAVISVFVFQAAIEAALYDGFEEVAEGLAEDGEQRSTASG